MSLDKFLNILTSRTLYFPNIAAFRDPTEGSIPEANRVLRESVRVGTLSEGNALAREMRKLTVNGKQVDFYWILDHKLRQIRQGVFVSCWHENTYESMAMWSLYDSQSANVAVVPTAGALCETLPPEALVSRVQYADPNLEAMEEPALLAPFFYKWNSYAHEKEVRAVIFDHTYRDLVLERLPLHSGRAVEVDPARLIQRVVLAPNAPGVL